MVSAYTVKIGGTPTAPGNTYTSAAHVRYGRGINRVGVAQFDLIGLNGQAEPAEGDYVEVIYGATAVWAGFVREVKRELDDIVRHVTATDGLGELDRRDIDARRSFSGVTEGEIADDILSQVGITSATRPLRNGDAGARGNAFGSYRVQYANALRSLLSLATVYGREVIARKQGVAVGDDAHSIFYDVARIGDHSVSQATWRAGNHIMRADPHGPDGGAPTLHTDNWEKLDNVRVLGQGDGLASSDTYGGTSGASGDRRAVVPAKNLNDAAIAAQMANTLKAAFADPRLVVVCPLRFFNLEIDQGIGIGDRVTVEDYEGNSIGAFRVMYLETDPEYSDGWFTRVTLIRATTSGGADYPCLPGVTGPAGVRPPGLVDMGHILNDPLTHTQLAGTVASGATGSASQPSATVADGASRTATLVMTTAFDPAKDSALQFLIQASVSADGWFDVQLTLEGTVLFFQRLQLTASGTLDIPLVIVARAARDFVGAGVTIDDAVLTVTNRTGADKDIACTLYSWIQAG